MSKAALVALVFCLCLIFVGCGEGVPEKKQESLSIETKPAAVSSPKSLAGKKCFIVQSYHREYSWGADIAKGIKRRLEAASIDYEFFYMDTKRKTDESWKVYAGQLAAKKVKEYNPDVIIAADDNAQQYFAKEYVGKDVFVVFCGVNADPTQYGYPSSNVTGIIERPHFKLSMDLAKEALGIKSLAMLSSNDPTSVGAFAYMKQVYVDVNIKDWKLIDKVDEWKSFVKECNDRVDALAIYMYHTVKDENGKVVSPSDLLKWTVENSKIPILGFFDFGIKDGLLLGIVASGEDHGDKAAEYAIKLLQGVPIASLPVRKSNVGTKILNRSTAKKLNIALTPQLLKDAMVVE